MAADIGVGMQRTIVGHEDRLAQEVQHGDTVGVIEAEVIEATHAGPLVAQHLALAVERVRVDVVLPGECGFHRQSMPSS